MTLDSFFQRIGADNRLVPGTHELRPALSDKELLLWEKSQPAVTVPEELLALLRRSNGFRLRLNKDSPGGADCCFSALKDLQGAGRFMYGGAEDDLVPRSWYALASDPDCSTVLIIDMGTGEFLDVDPIDPDEPEKLSKSVNGALTWLSDFLLDTSEGR